MLDQGGMHSCTAEYSTYMKSFILSGSMKLVSKNPIRGYFGVRGQRFESVSLLLQKYKDRVQRRRDSESTNLTGAVTGAIRSLESTIRTLDWRYLKFSVCVTHPFIN